MRQSCRIGLLFTDVVCRAHLLQGGNQTSISSIVPLRVLEAQTDPDSEFYSPEDNVFQKLGHLRSVAQKILENAANEKPIVSRPAREARDIIRNMDDDSLKGLF